MSADPSSSRTLATGRLMPVWLRNVSAVGVYIRPLAMTHLMLRRLASPLNDLWKHPLSPQFLGTTITAWDTAVTVGEYQAGCYETSAHSDLDQRIVVFPIVENCQNFIITVKSILITE